MFLFYYFPSQVWAMGTNLSSCCTPCLFTTFLYKRDKHILVIHSCSSRCSWTRTKIGSSVPSMWSSWESLWELLSSLGELFHNCSAQQDETFSSQEHLLAESKTRLLLTNSARERAAPQSSEDRRWWEQQLSAGSQGERKLSERSWWGRNLRACLLLNSEFIYWGCNVCCVVDIHHFNLNLTLYCSESHHHYTD